MLSKSTCPQQIDEQLTKPPQSSAESYWRYGSIVAMERRNDARFLGRAARGNVAFNAYGRLDGLESNPGGLGFLAPRLSLCPTTRHQKISGFASPFLHGGAKYSPDRVASSKGNGGDEHNY